MGCCVATSRVTTGAAIVGALAGGGATVGADVGVGEGVGVLEGVGDGVGLGDELGLGDGVRATLRVAAGCDPEPALCCVAPDELHPDTKTMARSGMRTCRGAHGGAPYGPEFKATGNSRGTAARSPDVLSAR